MISSLQQSSAQTRTDPIGFFDTTLATCSAAVEKSGGAEEQVFQIGRQTIRLCFAGPALAETLTRALEHLRVPSTAPVGLTVYLWDDASTRTRMPPPPWVDYDAYTRRGDVRGYNTGRIYTAYNYSADVLNVLDVERRTAIYWTRDARRLPSYELSAPLRTILHWLANLHGSQLVHGGVVGLPNGGVLLAGKGGSGKSTSVLACLESPLRYIGDDYVWLEPERVPFVRSLYSSAKVDADNLFRVPHLLPALSNAEALPREKAVFYLFEHWADKILSGLPIMAILLPHVSETHNTYIMPATPQDALKALALSTIAQLPRADQLSLDLIQRLIDSVPSYHLALGSDLTQIPGVIASVIEKEQQRDGMSDRV